MAIPLLDYSLKSQNQRVQGFEVAGEGQPVIYSAEDLRSSSEMDELIRAAYLQVFHEQQMLKSNRQTLLESQLRNGQITVREFVRGLALSNPFRTNNYNANSNYRFVQLCVQRLLGREVYSDRETQSWSIVLATRGLQGFVDALILGDEYETSFGDDVVPYQRRRLLPQRLTGELPFERMPRYTADYRLRQESLGVMLPGGEGSASGPSTWDGNLPPKFARQIGAVITFSGATVLLGMVGAVALAAFGFISL